MSKIAAHIFLSTLILVSSFGFTLFERNCNMSGVSTTLTADHGDCCKHGHAAKPVQKKKKSCCKATKPKAPVAVDQKQCCSFSPIYVQGHAGTTLTVQKQIVPNILWLQLPTVNISLPAENFATAHQADHLKRTPPDPDGHSIRILFQSFTC